MNNTKTWKVRSKGRVQFFLLYLVLLTVALFGLFLLGILEGPHSHQGGKLFSNVFYHFRNTLFANSPVVLVLAAAPSYWIFKKKVPRNIMIDEENGQLSLMYSPRDTIQKMKDEYVFSFHKHNFYSVLVFYELARATKPGTWKYKQQINMLAPVITTSWKPATLHEIADELEKAGFTRLEKEDKMSFFWRMID